MIQLTKKIQFAVEAVLAVAHNSGSSSLQSKDIAESNNIPNRYLETLLQDLVKFSILKGIRGPKGGYVLARERRNISLADIVEAVIDDNTGDSLEDGDESYFYKSFLHPLLKSMRDESMSKLRAVTVEDIFATKRYKDAYEHKSRSRNPINFSI